jgi:membrane fusion protein, multidrug efflux system
MRRGTQLSARRLPLRQDAPTEPTLMVKQGLAGFFGYSVSPGDPLERGTIIVAAIQDGVAIVTKGLKPGKQVAVIGHYRLTNSARIVPKAAHRPGSTT